MALVIWQENGKIKRQQISDDHDAEAFAKRICRTDKIPCGVNTNDGRVIPFKPVKEK